MYINYKCSPYRNHDAFLYPLKAIISNEVKPLINNAKLYALHNTHELKITYIFYPHLLYMCLAFSRFEYISKGYNLE